MKAFVLLALSLMMMGANCNKDKIKHYEDVFFQFDMPFSIEPKTEAIHVGDTINLMANIADSLFDLFSSKKYFLPNFYFPVLLNTLELVDSSKFLGQQPGANHKFDFIFPTGYGKVTSVNFADLTPVYDKGVYSYKCKLVAKQPGVYTIWLMDASHGRFLPQEFAPEPPGWQRVPQVRFNRYIINNGDTHLSLFEQHCKLFTGNTCYGCGELLEKNMCYTFRVVP